MFLIFWSQSMNSLCRPLLLLHSLRSIMWASCNYHSVFFLFTFLAEDPSSAVSSPTGCLTHFVPSQNFDPRFHPEPLGYAQPKPCPTCAAVRRADPPSCYLGSIQDLIGSVHCTGPAFRQPAVLLIIFKYPLGLCRLAVRAHGHFCAKLPEQMHTSWTPSTFLLLERRKIHLPHPSSLEHRMRAGLFSAGISSPPLTRDLNKSNDAHTRCRCMVIEWAHDLQTRHTSWMDARNKGSLPDTPSILL